VQNKREKADLLFLRGKALDYQIEYTKIAEDFLAKSIKLVPNNYESWAALGHVYLKKGDIVNAKRCVSKSLEQV
jgi:Tfp pilus assembly protein PilF